MPLLQSPGASSHIYCWNSSGGACTWRSVCSPVSQAPAGEAPALHRCKTGRTLRASHTRPSFQVSALHEMTVTQRFLQPSQQLCMVQSNTQKKIEIFHYFQVENENSPIPLAIVSVSEGGDGEAPGFCFTPHCQGWFFQEQSPSPGFRSSPPSDLRTAPACLPRLVPVQHGAPAPPAGVSLPLL